MKIHRSGHLIALSLFVLGLILSPPAAFSSETGSDASSETAGEAWDILDDLDEEGEDVIAEVSDPLYYWNKAMFHVNDKLYFWVLKPVATGYKTVTPTPVRTGVKNFFRNLTTPVRFVNCLLQGKSEQAGVELGRFMVNTTVGVLGFGNPAEKEPNLKQPADAEDLGQTLGLYGIGNGFYIVWPFFGPSTLRDSLGMVGDMPLTPLTYVDPTVASAGIRAIDTINALSFRLGDYESLKKAALEPYEAFRNAYVQNRDQKIKK